MLTILVCINHNIYVGSIGRIDPTYIVKLMAGLNCKYINLWDCGVTFIFIFCLRVQGHVLLFHTVLLLHNIYTTWARDI